MAEKLLYVLAGYDDDTEEKLSGMQNKLYELGFSGVQTKNIPMHFTLGSFETEREEEMVATLPGNVREDDILGISAEGDTLLVNLSESFRAEIQEQGEEQETLICYSMVNTLCKNTGMKRIRFYFEGEQVEYVAGALYWAGEFMYNIGLAEKGLG